MYVSNCIYVRERKPATLYKYICLCQGQRVKAELVDLVKDMTSLYAEIERSAVKLKPASQYYRAFVSFMLGRQVELFLGLSASFCH